MITVYVVGYEYNTGGGFDWYPKPEQADKAFIESQKDDELFADENHKSFRFDYEVTSLKKADKEIATYFNNEPKFVAHIPSKREE